MAEPAPAKTTHRRNLFAARPASPEACPESLRSDVSQPALARGPGYWVAFVLRPSRTILVDRVDPSAADPLWMVKVRVNHAGPVSLSARTRGLGGARIPASGPLAAGKHASP